MPIHPNELQNQLKSQSLGDVLASAFKQVGEKVFPDKPAMTDLMQFRNIVYSWAATHSPLMGNPIPNTGTAYSVVPTENDVAFDLIAAGDNEVIHINAVSITNGGGAAPVVVDVKIGASTVASAVAGPSTSVAVIIYNPIQISKGQALTVTVTSGTPTDVTGNASGVNMCI